MRGWRRNCLIWINYWSCGSRLRVGGDDLGFVSEVPFQCLGGCCVVVSVVVVSAFVVSDL